MADKNIKKSLVYLKRAQLEVYTILHSFGLNLEKDLKDVINGTSELYLIDGKEVKE